MRFRYSKWLVKKATHSLLFVIITHAAAFLSLPVMAQEYAQVTRLADMSFDQLSKIEVTSVSKSPEQVGQAPAAIYVITHDDIMRIGATSIVQALRLAPNLTITQMNGTTFSASARGFGGSEDAQNFSNKLLVLIDGRSVYTPLYSGVYFETQDVLMDDIDRIEVISGPGATLWGANAMNGVINIITRSARHTQGTLLSASTGNTESSGNARYGGDFDNGAFRIYGKAIKHNALELVDGSDAENGWSQTQGGFRLDATAPMGDFTVQGDAYHATEDQAAPGSQRKVGVNTLVRWQHHDATSDTQLQLYYDLVERQQPVGGVALVLHTYDIEFQQSLRAIAAHNLVWGAGERINQYHLTSSESLIFSPEARTLTLANFFVQDTYSITRNLDLIGGLKMEDDPYYGWSVLPDLRLALRLNNRSSLWAATSRAIRSPTPFDEDVVEKLGTIVFVTGSSEFKPEEVTAYELGYRTQLGSSVSLSLSGFYNVYDNLRTIELASSTEFLPLHWGNMMEGNTYGWEAWGQWQVCDFWRLSPGIRTVHKRLRFKAGASGLLGIPQSGNDPSMQASLKSSFDFGRHLTLDMSWRYVGELPSPELPAYSELNARLGWQVSEAVELSVTGANLLHPHHLEIPAPDGEEIQRSVAANVRWSF